MKKRWSLVLLMAAAGVAACGDSTEPTGSTTGGGNGGGGGAGGNGGNGGGGGAGGGGAMLVKPDAGITGCAKMFIDSDGVCRPTIEKCPKGTIPKFDTGCAPVGISTCAAAFKEADGFCHPTMTKCAADEFAVPSEGCVKIDGAGCGTDTYGNATDQAGDQHVDPTTTGTTPDGSRENPWASIAEGIAHVASGGRVLLAAGTYAEPISITTSVSVIGRCPSMVTVSGSSTTGGDGAVVGVAASAAAVTLQGITVTGDADGMSTLGSTLTVEDVVFDGNQDTSVELGPTTNATLHHVVVRNTRPSSTNQFGFGVDAYSGAKVTIKQSAIVDNQSAGVTAEQGPTLVTLDDTLIEGVKVEASDQAGGHGVVADNGAEMKLHDVAVVATEGPGIGAYDATSINAADCLVDKASGPHSLGLDIERTTTKNIGVDFTGSGLAVLGTDGTGCGVYNLGKATLSGSLFAYSLVNVQMTGEGFYVNTASTLTLTDSAIVGNQGSGILVNGNGSSASLDGVLIEGNKEIPPGLVDAGEGAFVQFGASAVFTRVADIGNSIEGLAVISSVFNLSDSLISANLPSQILSPGADGAGMTMFSSVVDLKGLRVEKAFGAGLSIVDTGADLSDVVVDTVSDGVVIVRDGASGPTLGVADGILVTRGGLSQGTALDHVWVTNAKRAGLLFSDSAGSIDTTFAAMGAYGLVTQGTPVPRVGTDNELSGSTKDVLTKGTLPAP